MTKEDIDRKLTQLREKWTDNSRDKKILIMQAGLLVMARSKIIKKLPPQTEMKLDATADKTGYHD